MWIWPSIWMANGDIPDVNILLHPHLTQILNMIECHNMPDFVLITLRRDSLIVTWFILLLHGSLSECAPGPLGMASGDIPDSSITASSYQTHPHYDREPKYARLGGSRFWYNDWNDLEPWIQVDLGSSYNVTGLQTEGYSNLYWVKKIKVQVGMTIEDLSFIEDGQGQPKVC